MAKQHYRLVVFNWKENPRTAGEAVRLFAEVARVAVQGKGYDVRIVACPPIIYLPELSKKLAGPKGPLSLGAQNVFWENDGAYTGETGPAMLRDAAKNIRYVIVGHSERRRLLGETDEMAHKKVLAVLSAGLSAILCVGEPAEVREKGIRAVKQYIKNQLKKDLQRVPRSLFGTGRLVIAYEPIWSIGTGRNCPPMEALAMAQVIKQEILRLHHLPPANCHLPVLYGGSVDGKNIADYICYNEIDGVLVGGASLRADQIKKIVGIVKELD